MIALLRILCRTTVMGYGKQWRASYEPPPQRYFRKVERPIAAAASYHMLGLRAKARPILPIQDT